MIKGSKRVNYFKWDDEKIDFLVKSYGIITPPDIANHLGCKVHSVHTKASFMRLTSNGGEKYKRKITTLPASIKQRYSDGEPAFHLCREIGVSVTTLTVQLKR